MEFERMSQPANGSQIEEELDYRAALADWFLDLSDSCIHNKANDDAVRYIELAFSCFYSLNGDLSSVGIEARLRALTNLISTEQEKAHFKPDPLFHKPVCLHVTNKATAYGGLISMLTRWIQFDAGARIHSVALVDQQSPPPAELVRAVTESGGEIYIADQKSSPLKQAEWLRSLALKMASCVVLHIDHCSLTAPIAFGSEGGPPVLVVNYPGHLYWAGISVADVVANVRGSQLEEYWTKVLRGAKNCVTIPIPLPDPDTLHQTETDRDERKSRAREIFGIPRESILIMTSGASYKFLPLGKIDFLKTCQDILEALPEAYLLAAGVIEDDRWREASSKSGNRLRAMGSLSQSKISILHQASDLYIEGFPLGSTTALLEAGLQGLPVVLAPAECPPPYGSDGVALDDTLERPANFEYYKQEVVRLCGNPAERTSIGLRLQKAILAHHTSAGWKRYLTNALQALPPEHCVHSLRTPVRTPPEIYEYWCEFMGSRELSRSILEDRIFLAFSLGLRPKITMKMKLACKNAGRIRAGGTIPLPLLSLLCNYFLPLLPLSLACIIFRIVKFFFLGSLPSRALNKLARLFWRANDSPQHFESQYHYIQENKRWFGATNQVELKEHLNRK
jgi:hypothetical protein